MTEISGGITGAVVLEVSGPERLVYEEMRVAFDPSLLYRVRARVKNTVRPTGALGNLIRVGLEGVSSDGRQLVGTDGANTIEDQYFVAASDYDMDSETLDEWVEFTGYVRGQGTYSAATGPASPSAMDAAVAYIQPVVWINLPDGDGTTQVGEVILDVLPEDASQIRIGSITVHQALEQDPDLVNDHSYSGRTAVLTVKSTVSSSFGQVLTTSLLDGEFVLASTYNRSTNGLFAIDLGLGTGKQRVVLPGSIVRDDSWTWLAGRTVYLSGSAGVITQTAPRGGMPRLVIGTALAYNLLYFSPQNDMTLSSAETMTGVIVSQIPSGYCHCIYQWTDGAIYVGTSHGLIYRSDDYGETWSEVFDSDENSAIVAFAPMGSSLYACASGGTGYYIYSSADGATWSRIYTHADQPDAYDLIKDPNANTLIIATGKSGSTGKIYSSTNGTTWTLRHTSSCESVLRLCGMVSYVLALEAGGSTARVLSSPDGTTWTVRATYTGYTSATDIAYVLGDAAAIVDGNRLYGDDSYPTTAEFTTADYAWSSLVVIDDLIYACGTNPDGDDEIWVRTDADGTWDRVSTLTNIYPSRLITSDTGDVFWIVRGTGYLYRLARLHSVVA